MNEEFERLIKEVVHDEIEESSSPLLSSSDSWERIQNELKRSSSQKKVIKNSVNKAIIYLTSAAIFILVLSIILTPQKGTAFNTITDMFNKAQNSVNHLFVKLSNENMVEMNDSPSNEFSIVEESEIVSKSMSLEEATKFTKFSIRTPRELPTGYILIDATVILENGETSNEISLNYENEKNGFKIWERAINEEYGLGNIVDSEDTKLEEISIKGRDATLLLYKNNVSKLIWTDQNLLFVIEGQLTKEEILLIANGL